MSPVCLSGGRWRDFQDRRSRGLDMHSPLHTLWREAVRERDDERSTRAPEWYGWRAAPAAKPLGVLPATAGRAGRDLRGAREGIRPAAGCGRAPHSLEDRVSACKKAVRQEALLVLMENRGTLIQNTKPFGSRQGEKGTRTRTGRTDTGRTAVGRAGPFNLEEPLSSLFQSYGPSLRENRLRSFQLTSYSPHTLGRGAR